MTALKRKRFQQARTTSVRVESELGEERLLQPANIQPTTQVTNILGNILGNKLGNRQSE